MHEELVTTNSPTIALLPASLHSPLTTSENVELVELVTLEVKQESPITKITESEKNDTPRKGVLYVRPDAIAALIENQTNAGASVLKFIDGTADTLAALKLVVTVEGTPQEVAAKLGIDIT